MKAQKFVGFDFAEKGGEYACLIEGEIDDDGVLEITTCITVPRLIIPATPQEPHE